MRAVGHFGNSRRPTPVRRSCRTAGQMPTSWFVTQVGSTAMNRPGRAAREGRGMAGASLCRGAMGESVFDDIAEGGAYSRHGRNARSVPRWRRETTFERTGHRRHVRSAIVGQMAAWHPVPYRVAVVIPSIGRCRQRWLRTRWCRTAPAILTDFGGHERVCSARRRIGWKARLVGTHRAALRLSEMHERGTARPCRTRPVVRTRPARLPSTATITMCPGPQPQQTATKTDMPDNLFYALIGQTRAA
jgi:hypothetical protein